ncbi:unnamed protein product [Zymoseptoria tritici ST99CH_3D7]|uniref:Uncharacterized protein n=1 Tax=Zymoseptoria tritici (strain ST99CH_3D7) TaxID=1276538 RepID=A0A1X7RVS9_ZYMT9|nr:unnamed protein product [Zymoseptoria tritici ST99CH_3D7]
MSTPRMSTVASVHPAFEEARIECLEQFFKLPRRQWPPDLPSMITQITLIETYESYPLECQPPALAAAKGHPDEAVPVDAEESSIKTADASSPAKPPLPPSSEVEKKTVSPHQKKQTPSKASSSVVSRVTPPKAAPQESIMKQTPKATLVEVIKKETSKAVSADSNMAESPDSVHAAAAKPIAPPAQNKASVTSSAMPPHLRKAAITTAASPVVPAPVIPTVALVPAGLFTSPNAAPSPLPFLPPHKRNGQAAITQAEEDVAERSGRGPVTQAGEDVVETTHPHNFPTWPDGEYEPVSITKDFKSFGARAKPFGDYPGMKPREPDHNDLFGRHLLGKLAPVSHVKNVFETMITAVSLVDQQAMTRICLPMADEIDQCVVVIGPDEHGMVRGGRKVRHIDGHGHVKYGYYNAAWDAGNPSRVNVIIFGEEIKTKLQMAQAIYVARCPSISDFDAQKIPVRRIDFVKCSFIDPDFLAGLPSLFPRLVAIGIYNCPHFPLSLFVQSPGDSTEMTIEDKLKALKPIEVDLTFCLPQPPHKTHLGIKSEGYAWWQAANTQLAIMQFVFRKAALLVDHPVMLRQCSYYINRAKRHAIDPDNWSSFQEVRNADFPLAKLTKLVTILAKGLLKTNEALVEALGKNDPDAEFVYEVLEWYGVHHKNLKCRNRKQFLESEALKDFQCRCCLDLGERTFGAFIEGPQIKLCKKDEDGMCTLGIVSEASEKYFNDLQDNAYQGKREGRNFFQRIFDLQSQIQKHDVRGRVESGASNILLANFELLRTRQAATTADWLHTKWNKDKDLPAPSGENFLKLMGNVQQARDRKWWSDFGTSKHEAIRRLRPRRTQPSDTLEQSSSSRPVAQLVEIPADSSTPLRTGLFGNTLPPVDVAANNASLVANGNLPLVDVTTSNLPPAEADNFPPVPQASSTPLEQSSTSLEQGSSSLAHWAGLPATPLPFRKPEVIDDRKMQRICKWDLAKQGKHCPPGCRAIHICPEYKEFVTGHAREQCPHGEYAVQHPEDGNPQRMLIHVLPNCKRQCKKRDCPHGVECTNGGHDLIYRRTTVQAEIAAKMRNFPRR